MKREKSMMRKSWIVVFAAVLIALFLVYVGINLYARFFNAERIYTLEEANIIARKPDAILVLGAGVREDGSPSNMLQDRLLTALRLFEMGVSNNIIVSGDHGTRAYDEVNVMKAYLIDRGVPSECIFMDHAGFSTYDSVYRAKAIFGVKNVLIVTQEYHAYRSLMIAHHLGLESVAVSAPILSSDVKAYPRQSWYSFRETLARAKDFFISLVKLEPTYLGEQISLEAGGDVTNDGKSH